MVFERDRDCPKWYPWTPGFSPKEHLEDSRANQLERDRRRFELRLTVGLAVVALAFAALEVIATVAGLPEDSWFVRESLEWHRVLRQFLGR